MKKILFNSIVFFLVLSPVLKAQWIQQSSGSPATLFTTNFLDSSNGFAAGGNEYFLKTTDSGNNWAILNQGGSDDFYADMHFRDTQTGWTVLGGWSPSRHCYILKTTDGGISWTTQFYIDGYVFISIYFVDDQIGWAVGTNGIIYNSTNGGSTWNLQYHLNTSEWLYDVFFVDQNIGWVVGNLGDKILKTTDGGNSWQWIPCGSTDWHFDIEFIDQNNGIIVGDNGRILKSSDGGSNWNIVQSGITSMFRDVEYITFGKAWIVGHDGVILNSTDDGITWTLQSSGTIETLLSVSFTDAYNGNAVGENGTILRTTNGGGILVPPNWSNQIIVEDAGGIESSEVLTIGQHPDATDSIDASLGEYELPPPPFTSNFDARFILPTNPEMGSLIDIRDSSLAEITWKMTFQPSTAGYPITFSWDSTSFPEGTFYLKDRIDGSYVFVNMKNQSSYNLTEPAITSLNISYRGSCSMVSVNNEWNMLSVPVLAEDMALSNLFSTATSPAYGYDNGYVMEDTLAAGVGYWLKFGGDEVIQICGALMGDTVQVKAGWNMIGTFEEDIPVSQITTTPPGIIATYFFGFNDGYNIADTLKSGKGYWVRVTEDGVLNLNSGSLAKGGEEEQIAKVDQEWGKIKITDSEGKSITLYASEEEMELSLYELPPSPPTGIFDARYSSGKLVESLTSEKTIQISSEKYPITIRAEGISIRIRDRIDGKILDEELNSGEEIRITNNKITSIEVTGRITGGMPITYKLYQNYPNPFNPSTTIKFAVPEESNVNLSIYNVLGELVSTLVNEEMKPGYYEYEFNASNLASGIYLYRIKAGSFVETKKMTLMK